MTSTTTLRWPFVDQGELIPEVDGVKHTAKRHDYMLYYPKQHIVKWLNERGVTYLSIMFQAEWHKSWAQKLRLSISAESLYPGHRKMVEAIQSSWRAILCWWNDYALKSVIIPDA